MMSIKCAKTLRKLKQSRTKVKGRFEYAASKLPLKYKELYDFEDALLSISINSHITRGLYSNHTSLFKGLYSDKYNWLDYSSFLYNVYEVRSTKAYVGIKKLPYVESVYEDNINNLYNNFIEYYTNTLGLSFSRISKSNMKTLHNTCVWLIFHINRTFNDGQLGIRFSYWINFYTECQDIIKPEDKIGGKFVQRLIDFLVYSGQATLYKGYNLKDTYKKTFKGEGSYSGETKSCMSLLLLSYDTLADYLLRGSEPIVIQNYSSESETKPTFYEIRRESGCKAVIPLDEFEESWMDKITLTEKVMEEHQRMLVQSMISLGKYRIPEIHFKRIWISSVYDYGRVHDTGEFQTKSKALRKQIIIDGEATCTIDLSSIHPRILYTEKGITLADNFDPYPALSNVKLDKSRIRRYKNFYDLEKYNPLRNLAKVALLILLNANSYHEAKYALADKIKAEESRLMTRRESEMWFIGIPPDVDLDLVLQEVMNHNAGIKEYFASGVSMKLMNKDSDIIIDAIDSLNSLGIVCLPLHDSLTVRLSYKEEAKKALEYGYKNVMGTLLNFKCEEE